MCVNIIIIINDDELFHYVREKVSKLEDYLGNTPTVEEHSSIKEQVTDLHSQNILLTERLKEKEDKMMSQMNELREKVNNNQTIIVIIIIIIIIIIRSLH